MTWFGWSWIVLGFFSLLGNISLIGKPREPVRHVAVVVQALIYVGYVAAIFTIGTGHL